MRKSAAELILLLLGYIFGIGATAMMWRFGIVDGDAAQARIKSAVVDLILTALVLGSTFAASLVVVSQVLLHRRTMWLSLGEWLWIAPTLDYAFAWVTSNAHAVLFRQPSPIWFLLAVSIQYLCSVFAIILLGIRLYGEWGGGCSADGPTSLDV